VLANDGLGASSPAVAGVTLSQLSTTNAGVTLNTLTGAVNVAPGTPEGTYTVTYQICALSPNQTVCDTATAQVTVAAVSAVGTPIGTPGSCPADFYQTRRGRHGFIAVSSQHDFSGR
jgi:large repetitive protein